MDTKWKNIRNVLSFIVFFLGVSLTLGNFGGLLRRLPDRMSDWTAGKWMEFDYQQSDDFRWYISNRLENFLSIAVKGCPADWNYYDEAGSLYYGNPIGAVQDLVVTESTGTAYWDEEDWEDWEEYLEELEEEQEYWDRWNWYYNEYGELVPMPVEQGQEQKEQLTEEEKEKLLEEQQERLARHKQRLTEMYFKGMEEDKNLLYSIYYDGRLLYSNTELLPADGSMQAPEGYNFLLYFDGEKVRITKDGREEDIYGDGYYRTEKEWYVPGYRNFPVDDGMKKAVVCMAAAKDPVQYTLGMNESGGYRQQENGLYWIQYRAMARKALLHRTLIGFGTGLALLLLSVFCRKGRREAVRKIAVLQGRVWVECKVVLAAAAVAAGWQGYMDNGGRFLWQEVSWVYADGGMEAVSESGYLGSLLRNLDYWPDWFWPVLFWMVYLTVNDLRHNGKVWRQGLIAKCCRLFSTKELKLPPAKKMVRRNGILLGASALGGIYALAVTVDLVKHTEPWNTGGMWMITLLYILMFSGILLSVYLVGKKNLNTAREVEALTERIGEICSGDYSRRDSAGETEEQAAGSQNAESRGAADAGAASAGAASARAASARAASARAASALACGSQAAGDLGTARAQLENIRQGMADAVDEQMKSERMKVELIANVSHDLKTPLTSIISYVQFLKQEEGLPEHVKDYVRILDEKSERLKNMVQDVFAVSKAASGELPMCMETLDFGKLLRQTLADMDEEIRNSKVSFRTELPEEPVMILADGQRMYRVFQNLFQNALKYSLDGSRVYVSLKTEGKTAVACVKNTSHMELDEDQRFTERFFRGDRSRTDGGSGLGLSIAQSFTEACGGRFEMEFNADLFIVRVSFQTDCV